MTSTNKGNVVAILVIEDDHDHREEIHMPRFQNLTAYIGRFGGRGALDNVSEVLTARAQATATINEFEARVAKAAA